MTETFLLLECENLTFYKTVLGDAWRLLNLRCTFCIFNSSCANERRRSTSMQPVYRRSLGTHRRGITVCLCVDSECVYIHEWVLDSLLAHVCILAAFSFRPTDEHKLLKLSEIDCKRSLHDFEDPIIFPYNYQVNALNISYFFLLYFWWLWIPKLSWGIEITKQTKNKKPYLD